MSNSVASSVSNPIAPQPAPIASLAGISTNGSDGLFLNFMSLFGQQHLSQNNGLGSKDSSTPLEFGVSGFNFDPALLVLPSGMANLSEEELKAFLATQTFDGKGGLTHGILQSLTAGTPATTTFAANQNGESSMYCGGPVKNISTLPPVCILTVGMPTEVITTTLDAENADPLLLATGLSPAQMEQIKKQLDAAIEANKDTQDLSDNSNMAFIALISLVPQTISPTAADAATTSTTIGTSNVISPSIAGFDIAKSGRVFSFEKSEGRNMSMSEYAAASADGGATEPMTAHNNDGLAPHTNTNAQSTNEGNKPSVLVQGQMEQILALQNTYTDDFFASGTIPFGSNAATVLPNPSQLTAPLLNNPSAISGHPVIQTIAMKIEKAAKAESKEQILSIQLDPPELGRVQIQLTYEKGEPMKVHLLAEKQDTFNLLQRDSHALKDALAQTGIQMDGSSLSFDMASGDQNFDQMLGQFNQGSTDKSGKNFSLNADSGAEISELVLHTHMNDIPDFTNGNTKYNFLV